MKKNIKIQNRNKLLRKVIQLIQEEPKRMRMEDWVNTDDRIAPCRTTGCIAGCTLIAHLMNTKPELKDFKMAGKEAYKEVDWSFSEEARRLLELSETEGERLFYVDNWPDKFQRDYYKVRTRTERTLVVIRRIKHFMRTGR